jgi:ABC-type phosphate/phosphonate transport system substrate-binding protein
MTACRLVPWCLAPLCLLALLPASALSQGKSTSSALKIRIYSSLLPGLSQSEAIGSTKPMCDIIGRKVGEQFECAIEGGTTAADLFTLGKKLKADEYQLAAVWGLEYGWLRELHPQLKVLAVVSLGDGHEANRTKLFVRKGSPFKKLADLKGKRLAVYKDTPFMDRFFLNELVRAEKLEPAKFFEKTAPFASVRQAAAAVKNAENPEADCVVISNTTFARLQDCQPGVANGLVELASSEVYPAPVVVGFPDVLEKGKRKGLWTDLRDQFLNVHNSSEGKECINFWRFEFFVKPEDDFQKRVDEMARKYPVKVLLNLE